MTPAPSKRDLFLVFLSRGWPSLYVDPRRPGVVVPSHVAVFPCLSLRYGYNLPIPIPDMSVEEGGVRATLSFDRTPHATFVPWSAVYAIVDDDGRGIVYTGDVPADVVAATSAVVAQAMRPTLTSVPAEAGNYDGRETVVRDRPSLRIVRDD